MTHEELARELNQAMKGMSVLEKALLIADALRDVWGDGWVIEAHGDGGFSIVRSNSKPL